MKGSTALSVVFLLGAGQALAQPNGMMCIQKGTGNVYLASKSGFIKFGSVTVAAPKACAPSDLGTPVTINANGLAGPAGPAGSQGPPGPVGAPGVNTTHCVGVDASSSGNATCSCGVGETTLINTTGWAALGNSCHVTSDTKTCDGRGLRVTTGPVPADYSGACCVCLPKP